MAVRARAASARGDAGERSAHRSDETTSGGNGIATEEERRRSTGTRARVSGSAPRRLAHRRRESPGSSGGIARGALASPLRFHAAADPWKRSGSRSGRRAGEARVLGDPARRDRLAARCRGVGAAAPPPRWSVSTVEEAPESAPVRTEREKFGEHSRNGPRWRRMRIGRRFRIRIGTLESFPCTSRIERSSSIRSLNRASRLVRSFGPGSDSREEVGPARPDPSSENRRAGLSEGERLPARWDSAGNEGGGYIPGH